MTETPETGGEQSSAERPETGLTAHEPGSAEAVVTGRERRGMFGVHGTGDTSGYGGVRLPAYSPAPAERPYGGWFDQFADEFYAALSDHKIPAESILQTTVDRGEITFYVAREKLAEIAKVLRDDGGLRFELLSSVSGVDYGVDIPQRLHAVYHFTSLTYRRRIRLEVTLDIEDPHVPSLVGIYPTADWQEREAWDMFGIVFDGHPALTRILMPDDWDGFPQRKDYPLGGVPVEYHDATIPPPDTRRSYR